MKNKSKKILIISSIALVVAFIILFIIFKPVTQSGFYNAFSCSDSGTAVTYSVSSIGSGTELKYQCISSTTLRTFFCGYRNNYDTFEWKETECSAGCSNNKCNTPTANCYDGIQNQGETGVDCGGPCQACVIPPTCSDGIQNQGETGVDCGGPCSACIVPPNCYDGIQNQGEVGVDCGGPCSACVVPPNCYDGIQNQDELGIDCGGMQCPACTPNKITVYRFSSNSCTQIQILPSDRTSNDYDTLAECETHISPPFPWQLVLVISGAIIIIGFAGFIVYLSVKRKHPKRS